MKQGVDLILIEKAMTLEVARYNTYKELSKTISNREAKEVLIKLAKIEKKHYKLLKIQIKSIRKFNKVNLDAVDDNQIQLRKKEMNFRRVNSSIESDIRIVRAAENIERKDPPFYEHLSNETKNRSLKKVFQFLKKEEARHLKLLKSKLNDLENLSMKLSNSKDPRAMFYEMVNRK